MRCFFRRAFSCRYYHQLRVFLIAGEPSGDVIGSRLMASLNQLHPFGLKFAGVGGPLMEKQGLTSEFPMDDLSVMGALELLPHLFKLRARLKQTLVAAEIFQPDIVVAIDSKGFSFRVLKQLRAKCMEQQRNIPLSILYVAPSVWAWKGGERQLWKWIGIVDHILCILPFEESLCKQNGLAATFVGHPALEDAFFDSNRANSWTLKWHIEGDKKNFFSSHGLPEGTTLLSLLPGSRLQEVKRMMPIYRETLEILKDDICNLTVTIPTTFSSQLIQKIENEITKWDIPVVLLPGATLKQKYDAFNASVVGLCTSGTIVLQMQLARLPCVVAYRANTITEWLVKRSTQLRYMSLPNILLDAPIIPEAALSDCTPSRLAEMLRRLLCDDALRQEQIFAAEKVLRKLGAVDSERVEACQSGKQITKPSIVAARTILNLFETKG
ncbi:hypothetical protein GOP47_0016071 [Adiantum capillus-veneris]|uniref:lipid-A-disaccharide synthase n=1 Tax=Adiantum capillus-veneris TaxID=13818 RepID=A0A9D4UKZ8_ADICA|nr:hypothetical protein GOP47_0016071 [Adiantum capillus-veneris]